MAKITFKPNEDRVLVEAAAAEERTASGIIIPDTAKEKAPKRQNHCSRRRHERQTRYC